MGKQRQVEEYPHVLQFVRDNGRCPAEEFLNSCSPEIRKKFYGQFRAVGIMGAAYENHQRFRALTGKGKPLWEIKEHDHRLYCVREVAGKNVKLVLMSGWAKDKAGKGNEEKRQIARAKALYEEYIQSDDTKAKV